MKGVANDKITVTLPDGKQFDGEAWKTTPFDVANSISSGLAKSAVVAKVKYSSRISLPFQGEICVDDGMEDEMENNDEGDDGIIYIYCFLVSLSLSVSILYIYVFIVYISCRIPGVVMYVTIPIV
jgi:hypothetical protein